MMRSKEQKRNLKKYSKNHLHSKGKCVIIQKLHPCNGYGEVLKWSKRRDSKSRRALTRRVGSNPTFSAKKFDKFRLVEFFYPSRRLGIDARRLAIPSLRSLHQPLRGWISSRQRRVSHHASACILLRLDDIQCFALMIYTPSA